MDKIKVWLNGKKTYLVMLSGIIAAVLGWLSGSLELAGMIGAILGALGLGAVRDAIAKIGGK